VYFGEFGVYGFAYRDKKGNKLITLRFSCAASLNLIFILFIGFLVVSISKVTSNRT
jgi:hypothetical protein